MVITSPAQSWGSAIIHTVIGNADRYDVSTNRQQQSGNIVTGLTVAYKTVFLGPWRKIC